MMREREKREGKTVTMVIPDEDYRALVGLLRKRQARRLTNVLQGSRLNVSHHRGREKSCPACSLAQGRLVFKPYPEAFGGRQSWCLACRSSRTAGNLAQFKIPVEEPRSEWAAPVMAMDWTANMGTTVAARDVAHYYSPTPASPGERWATARDSLSAARVELSDAIESPMVGDSVRASLVAARECLRALADHLGTLEADHVGGE